MDTNVTARPNDAQSQLRSLYGEMAPQGLFPLWEVLHSLVTPHPQSKARAHAWSYDAAREYLLRAGDLISAEQAERRVLILENPGLPGTSAVTTSLYAGLQMILPGEVAPAHRHTQSALRFVLEGDGAHTTVDGEPAVMRPFDLVLTPNWQWHDHGNGTGTRMIWLDGLDIPTVSFFDASFAEKGDMASQSVAAAAGDSLLRYGRNLRPFRGTVAARRPAHQPMFHYPYAEWRESLRAMAREGAPDPHLGHAMEFVNPADGGSIMPTIAAEVRLLPRGFATLPRRSTDATVFCCVEGSVEATVGDETFALNHRDLLVVPAWRRLTLRATGDSDAVLFGYSDRAAQEKLGLFREERAAA